MIHDSFITRPLLLALVLGVLMVFPVYSQHGTWTQQDYFVNMTYTGVDAPDTLDCMALGGRNTSPKYIIRHTTNGGTTWRTILNIDTSDRLEFSGIAHPSPNLIVLVGFNGVIKRSTDAGDSWTLVPCDSVNDSNQVANFADVSMCDSLHGVTAAYGVFLKTDDGGVSWQRIPLPPGDLIWKVGAAKVACLAPHTYVFNMSSGVGCYFFRTNDDGQTWTSMKMETFMNSMKFSDSLHGIAAGDGKRKSSSGAVVRYDVVLRTTDGGLTWNTVLNREFLPGLPATDHLVVSPADRGNILVMGAVPFQSSDSGHTWEQGPDLEAMYKVWIVDNVTYPHKSRAWAVTRLSGLILRYDNNAVSSVTDNATTLDVHNLNLAIAPIPVREAMAVTFTLQKPEVCSIRLFDVMGRMVHTLDAGLQAAGAHTIQLQRGDLSAGAYLLQIQTSHGSTTRSIPVQ